MDQIPQLCSEQLFDLFSAGISDQAICMLDLKGHITTWNKGAENFFQYSATEIVGKPASSLLEVSILNACLERAFAEGTSNVERNVTRKNGTLLPAYLTFKTIYAASRLQGYALTARSLAYTKKTKYHFNKDAEYRGSGLFQKLIEHSYSGITLFDAHLNFIYRSPSASRITGFNDAGRSDITFSDIIHPADRTGIKDMLDDLLQKPGTSMNCSLRSRHYDGHFINLEGVFTNWLQQPDIAAIVLNFHDVTERQQADDTLKQIITELSAYKYALDASAIVTITDQNGFIRYVNENFCKISGYSEQELLGKDNRVVNSGYHNKAFMEEMWNSITAGNVWSGDVCNQRKDGSKYWVATTIVPFLNEHQKPYQYVSIFIDRTDAMLARQQLVEKNAQISNLLESINDAFIAVDRELRYTYVNQRTCEIVGMKAGDMLGKKMWELFPDVVGTATFIAIEEALNTNKPVTNEDYYAPFDLWQENHIYPSDSGLSIFISDITWRKREEQQRTLLADISQIFSQTAPLAKLMRQVMARLISANYNFCLAETWLLDRDNTQLNLCSQLAINNRTSEFFKAYPDLRQLKAGQGLPGATLLSGLIEFWQELKDQPTFLRNKHANKADLQSAFGVPLRYGERIIGVLLLGQNCNERPEQMNNTILQQIGDHLGSAISRRQLENDMQDIFEAASDIICIVGMDRFFKKVNPAMCELLGYSKAELLVMPMDALIHPDDVTESRDRMRCFLTGELQSLYFENRYLTQSGRTIHLAWTAAKGKEDGILFCIAKNISDKKEAQQAAEQFLKERNSILESIGDAFFSVDRDWTVQYWNKIAEQVLQTSKENILGKNLWSVFSNSVGSASYNNYHKAVSSGRAIHFEDYYATRNSWYDVSVYPSEGGLSVFFKDITTKKHIEQELKTQAEALEISNQRYSDLFQLSPLPKFVYDVETMALIDVNRAFVDHYGYSPKECLKMTLRDIRPQNEQELLDKAIANVAKSPHLYHPGIFTHLKKNGEQIKVEITSSGLKYNGRHVRIVLAIDVTERLKYLEAIEIQNQKLREISWMQSHVIRAPLSRIMGLVGLINTTAPSQEDTAQILEFIDTSAKELDEVVRAITENAKDVL